MRKLFLLTSMLFAAVSSIFAGKQGSEYYIIKDGKLCDDVQIIPYEPEDYDNSNLLIDTVIGGENVVCYVQRSVTFLDVKLKLDSLAPLNLYDNYVMVLEYMLPSEQHDDLISNCFKKPLFIIGYEPDFATVEKTPNAQKCSVSTMVDGKYVETDTWVTAEKYLYSHPSVSTIRGMVFSFARETKNVTYNAYIKNFYFKRMSTGVKPFYAESFDGYGFGSISDFYNEIIKVKLKKCQFLGGITPTVTQKDSIWAEDNYTSPLILFRDFLEDEMYEVGHDGSGYLDCELLHSLQMKPNRDSVVFENIPLPQDHGFIHSKMLMKMHKNQGRWEIAPEDSAEALTIDVPIRVKFNNCDEIFDLTLDTLKGVWTEYMGKLPVPDGATSMNLIFGSMKVGYLVDEIMFSDVPFTGLNDILNSAPRFNVDAYVDANGNIVVLNGELIATYNMKGQIASEADKTVVIFVKNEEGAVASKVMVK